MRGGSPPPCPPRPPCLPETPETVGSSPEEPEEHEEPEERVAELVFERDARSLHGALRLLPGAPLPAALLPAGSARSAATSSLGCRCVLIELCGD